MHAIRQATPHVARERMAHCAACATSITIAECAHASAAQSGLRAHPSASIPRLPCSRVLLPSPTWHAACEPASAVPPTGAAARQPSPPPPEAAAPMAGAARTTTGASRRPPGRRRSGRFGAPSASAPRRSSRLCSPTDSASSSSCAITRSNGRRCSTSSCTASQSCQSSTSASSTSSCRCRASTASTRASTHRSWRTPCCPGCAQLCFSSLPWPPPSMSRAHSASPHATRRRAPCSDAAGAGGRAPPRRRLAPRQLPRTSVQISSRSRLRRSHLRPRRVATTRGTSSKSAAMGGRRAPSV
mmetsp:Transcript_32098/g.84079  ORF Transcript_32098/g.84079 Transcript_32098/m.84079 type:complete len:300 (-) Transcript_32098:3067-3966(-)